MKYDWIVIEFSRLPNEIWCKRCGARQKYPEGAMPVDVWLAIGKAFTNIHKYCEESEGGDGL